MKIRKGGAGDDKVEMQMTPMIDVVFQLLAFFTLTLKIVSPEGDFNIKMPLAAPSQGIPPEALPPIKVRLHADSAGRLTSIEMAGHTLRNFNQLRQEIRGIVGDNPGPGVAESAEVEFDCDYQLHFRHVIEAITAVSGYIANDGQTIVKLVEKIKFSPPRVQQ
jgi:biopolymer transport protein ExbD